MTETIQRVCPVCGAAAAAFGPGLRNRPDAVCLSCGSLERHRFLAVLLRVALPESARSSTLLDVAPMRRIARILKGVNPDGYVGTDFDPDADGRDVDVVASLTDLPFSDDSVSLLVCYHVLEHVPEDARAMAEIARVLRADGLGLVQVPFRAGVPTDEDPTASVEERVRRFGQADHVRYYGQDFVPRLEAAGLTVLELRPDDVVDADVIRITGMVADERVWLVATDRATLPTIEDLRGQVQGWLAGAIALGSQPEGATVDWKAEATTARRDAAQWKKESARWKARYRELRAQPAERAMAKPSRPFRGRD